MFGFFKKAKAPAKQVEPDREVETPQSMDIPDDMELVTVKEALYFDYGAIPRNTIYYHIRKGNIRSYKTPNMPTLISVSDLKKMARDRFTKIEQASARLIETKRKHDEISALKKEIESLKRAIAEKDKAAVSVKSSGRTAQKRRVAHADNKKVRAMATNLLAAYLVPADDGKTWHYRKGYSDRRLAKEIGNTLNLSISPKTVGTIRVRGYGPKFRRPDNIKRNKKRANSAVRRSAELASLGLFDKRATH